MFCQAIRQIERLLQEAQEQKDSLMEGATGDEIYIENKTYCKLGHLHLLLEDYEKGTKTIIHAMFMVLAVQIAVLR